MSQIASAGFDLGREAYYSKSEDGLWVRSRWDQDNGVIDVAWHERIQILDGKVHWYDENGRVLKSEDSAFAKYSDDPWTSAGVIELDRPGFIEFSRKRTRRIIESILCHTSKLVALGFGDCAADVVEWFVRPEDGLFVVATDYEIRDGVGIFEGADGMIFTVSDLEDEQLSGVVKVGDHERFELNKRLEPGVLGDFLVSTVPV